MEEQHWWLATKIQESFHIGGYDNPTLLEDFMCNPENLGLINQFLGAKGPKRLLFFCEKPQAGVLSTRELRVTHSPNSVKDVNLVNSTVLYFIRSDTSKPVDPNHIEKDVLCGEIKSNALEAYTSMLSEIIVPLMKEKKDWGDCSKDNQTQFVTNLEKYQIVLTDSASSLQSHRLNVLRRPEHVLGSDYKQHRLAAQDPAIVLEYEEVVTEWISTIEAILQDSPQDKYADLTSGPLSELDRWRRRQRMMNGLTEELKTKESKAVISVLVTAKSKLVKRWKLVDTGITDASNEARDKVKYLDSLRRHFELFYQDATPWSVMTVALPGLLTAMKQMDSVSRYFARSGYLGYLFQKLTNQLVLVCKNHLRSAFARDQDDDLDQQLWTLIQQEIESKDLKDFGDPQCKHFKSLLETRLGKKAHRHGHESHRDREPPKHAEKGFYDRLKSCVVLLGNYRESVRSLTDLIGLGVNVSHYGSLNSVNNSGSDGLKAPVPAPPPPQPASPTKGPRSKLSVTTSPSKKIASGESPGILITDEEAITEHLDMLVRRLKQVMDVIATLAQYQSVISGLGAMPPPRREDLTYQETDEEIRAKKRAEYEAKKAKQAQKPPSPKAEPVVHEISEQGNLVAIAESETVLSENSETDVNGQLETEQGDGENPETESLKSATKSPEPSIDYNPDDVIELIVMQHGITKEDIELLNEYYVDEDTDLGPSVHSVVVNHLGQVTSLLSSQVHFTALVDVETKDKVVFEDVYGEFMEVVAKLERYLCAYIHALFMRRMPTHESINLLTRFLPVQYRQGMKNAIAEKFIDIFNGYEDDLIKVQQQYERFKDYPQRSRNSPPIGGAISWSRQLLQRLEEPMRVFRECKAVTSMADYSRVVKVYNRVATTLVQFENLWFGQLKSHMEHAKAGLQATLLIRHPQTREIIVNCDERVLSVMQEVKWLVRLGIPVPESAHMVLGQEERFKKYNDNLSLCLRELNTVLDMIPECFMPMYHAHIENVEQHLQPGLSTLAWNSTNIDAFLNQVYVSVRKLRHLVESVNRIIDTKVEEAINKMADMSYIDENRLASRTWPPEEFAEEIASSVQVRSQEVKLLVQSIEGAMHEAAALLNNRVFNATPQPEKKKTKSMSLRTSKSSSLSMEDAMVHNFLDFYSDELYRSVLMLTVRSLVSLAESCGCDNDMIRQLESALSATQVNEEVSPPPPSRSRTMSRAMSRASRATSAKSDMRRPMSVLSILSDMSWANKLDFQPTLLRFEIGVQFVIPDLVLTPSLDHVQNAINAAATCIINVIRGVHWFGGAFSGDSFHRQLMEDDVITELRQNLSNVIEDMEPVVDSHLMHFKMYEFLWKDDMKGNYQEFIDADPGAFILSREVERLLRIERKVLEIPSLLPVGPVVLKTDPIRNSLHGFAIVWKNQYATLLHEEAKKKLDNAVNYRTGVQARLEFNVTNLDQLNSTLHLLEELRDMENKIDKVYLPIENMYARLKDFELSLPRSEVEEVDKLRDKWLELMVLAESVSVMLLREKRGAFEQELDKQVKTFIVEVIQFRNAFDAQGPAVPNIEPQEAVQRLHMFTHKYHLYDQKRKTLDSVSHLFGIPCKPFSELDRTGEELELLGLLYGLYQKFIKFDQQFRDTLWADVDLENASREVESFWDGCLALPSKLKDWEAYHRMRQEIQEYLDVLPLLQRLAAKDVEIRNRHWLQVMQVTGSSFQLEANVFKLMHLLDIGLLKHRDEVEDICHCAAKELELEIKLRLTEEEWTEQVLLFEPYKKYGPIYLAKANTSLLIEQLEDAEALLANMLTSRFIGPMREEAASWAEKLKEVGEVLELWLEVQDLWQFLEAVFSNHTTAKDLPQEAKRFQRIDKGWIKMMKRAYDTKNVLQCCYGGEVPKANVLRHILEELEVCFKSLTTYLDGKRRAFPRFYFVSDPILLAMLSKPNELESIKPYLRSIFTAIYDVELTPVETSETDKRPSKVRSRQASIVSHSDQPVRRSTKIDKRLTHVQEDEENNNNNMPASIQTHISVLPSDEMEEVFTTWQAVGVASVDGEGLTLQNKVVLENGVEIWLKHLQNSVSESLKTMLCDVINDVSNGMPLEELPLKYPTQMCRFGLLVAWTREAEMGMLELRYDRKAIQNASKKWTTSMSKLPQALTRSVYKGSDAQRTRTRMEHMITYSIYLRDSMDLMAVRKLREATDFDWKRNLRCYVHRNEETGVTKPVLAWMDGRYQYGNEFYGAQPIVALTPGTDRCHLTMAQAIKHGGGAVCVGGATGTGKTETIKGFGHLLGHHINVFECTPQMDTQALGKMITGLAVDGCWGFFDNLHTISQPALAVLLDYCQTILSAARANPRANQATCSLADGSGLELEVDRNVSVFLAYDTRAGFQLPSDVKAMFRQVCLSRPEPTVLLKLKCASMGFRAPAVLATRLRIVGDLIKDQLPECYASSFGPGSLQGVLQCALHQKRALREDRAERNKDDASRSTSQLSGNVVQNAPQAKVRRQKVGIEGQPARAGQPPSMSFGKKGSVSQPLTAAVRVEHALVGKALVDVWAPKMSAEGSAIFSQIVKDVFQSLPEPPVRMRSAARQQQQDLQDALTKTAKDRGLVPTKQWLAKGQQIYDVSKVNPGVIIAGPPGVGKSTLVQSLVESLSSAGTKSAALAGRQNKDEGLGEGNHRLQKMNPLVVDDLSLMFGYLHNKDWVDGLVTSSWRKANRNQCTTWLCFDGVLHPGWADRFNTVLDTGRVLYLDNGDQLYLSDNMKLVFETDDLSSASPATVARSGIVYLDKKVVGWKPIAQAWMETRTQQEQHVLQRAFDKTVNSVSQFVLNETCPKVPVSEVGMFQTCIQLLSAMLADNKEIGGKQHIERLYLFCLIWSYGGLLEGNDRKTFSEHMKTLSSALPDDDHQKVSVFDFYVDESGEWDPWTSRVPEAVYADSQDVLGDIFVETVQTMQARVLMELAVASGQNVLLIGPSGAGKTALINDFIDTLDNQKTVNKRLVLSAGSKSSQLQQFIEANIYHRQGFVFGARENKKMQLFVDDLSMPRTDEWGVQSNIELLRQLMDDRVLCTLQKPFEWRTIEDLRVIAATTIHQSPTVANKRVAERLLRHFAVFNLPAAGEENMKKIVHGILETNLSQNEGSGLDVDLHSALAGVSCRLMSECQQVLRSSPLSGRQHYLFSLKDVVTCFRCLRRLPDESRADELAVLSMWRHEMVRVLKDRIARHSDTKWFEQTMDRLITETWPELSGPLQDHFVTFPVDVRHYQRGGHKLKTAVQPIESLSDVRSSVQLHLDRYNEEFSQSPLDVTLSEPVIGHVVRLHRILSYHHSGHALLIGSVGTHLTTLCQLVLHIADIPRVPVDSSKPNTFFDGLRSALRLTGSEGKVQAVLLTAYDLHDSSYLDALNSILVSGEYPHLFTNDEMDGLLQAVTPVLRRERPSLLGDPMKFFVSRVKANLHLLLCLPPDHELIQSAMDRYPGLLSGCQIMWVADWPMQALLGEAQYFLEYNELQLEPKELGESVSACLANIHSVILTETKQAPWAGDLNDDIRIQAVKSSETKKNKQTTVKVPNLPYSKSIIAEHVKQMHRGSGLGKNEIFVGPMTYRRFLQKFVDLYLKKSEERTEKVTQLEKVLSALSQSRADAKVIRKAIKTIGGRHAEAKTKTADLMKQLISKATLLEKLKAQVGMSTALSAFLQLNDASDEEPDQDDQLLKEEYDDYDRAFDAERAANLKSRHVKAKEELIVAKKNVEERRHNLERARQQVNQWRTKVDRPCIERIKAFSQPPMLIGHVMEMVLALVGKRIPGMAHEPRERDSGSTRDDASGIHSASSSTLRGQKKSSVRVDSGARVDRSQWKAYTKIMDDPQKFVNMLHNIQWEDGLADATMRFVESYLARGPDGTLGVTGEGSLLEGAESGNIKASRRTPSPDNTRGITIAAAKYSNEDAAVLVQYTIAIIEYSRLCGPLKLALDKQAELEREIEESDRLQREAENEPQEKEDIDRESEPEPVDLDENDLPRIQQEVADLQAEFDESVVEKHCLEMELQAMRERLKAATDMIDSLSSQESEWSQFVEDHSCNEVLLTNCVSAAAFLTYCGGFDTDSRKRLGKYFVQCCVKHGLRTMKTVIFKDIPLTKVMYDELAVKQTRLHGLPSTDLVLEHACFIFQQIPGGTAWPLICDTTNYSIEWLRKGLKAKETEHQYTMVVRYRELKSHLETSLAEGHALIITDCDLGEVSRDPRFRGLLKQRDKFLSGKHPFKMMVSDHEVECQPRFRLYLHSSDEAQNIPPTLAAYVMCLRFQLCRSDLEEILLDRFLVTEKARLADEMAGLNTEWLENRSLLAENERHMLTSLAGEARLMNDLSATKRLADLTKQYDEANESLQRVNAGIESILRAREGFRQIAKRGAVCYDVCQYMKEIDPVYQNSMQQFMDIYDTAIAHSDRASMKAVIERLTYSAYTSTVRSLYETDRFIYTMLLALEIEESQGRVGPGEREFLLSPQYGATIMQNLKISVDSRISQAKKPFDWMQDEAFNNLQLLASYYDWFQEMFERMPRDGRETQWRAMCEAEQSETLPLPDKADETFSPMQRLLIIRSLRPDRLMQLSTLFVQATLGKRFTTDVGYDCATLVKQSSASTPILLLHTGEAEAVLTIFTDMATKKMPTAHGIIHMNNISSSKDRAVRKSLQKAMEQGEWVLLHHVHNSSLYLEQVSALISDPGVKVDGGFRLWLSADTSAQIPTHLLQTAVKLMVDTPKTTKGTLYRCFSGDGELVKQDRSDWAPLLHNICYLHAAIRLRARFGGWLEPEGLGSIGMGQLESAARSCLAELQSAVVEGSAAGRAVPWNALRYQISELLYGSCVTNGHDQACLSALVDFWLSPTAIKRDFELNKVKYKLPLALFNPNAKQSNYIQGLENVSAHALDAPEACHMHNTADLQLGEDQYVFTRLNKVYDCMPTSETLSHSLFERPPTPHDGPPQHSVSAQGSQTQLDRGVMASASYAVLRARKEADLYDMCGGLLAKLPKTYSPDKISDYIAKIGGNTVFNVFIRREFDMLTRLVLEIKATLQAIRAANDQTILGDQLSSAHMEAADALLGARVPAHWRHLAGDTAPPAQYSAASWILDLQLRMQHFEKLLSLGKEKMPAYWLGAFFSPRTLLSLIRQDAYRQHCSTDKSGHMEPLIFHTEITARDKEHLRDPPPEGIFVYGIYLKGAVYDKASSELLDQASKQGPVMMPVIHLTCVPQHERFHGLDQAKQGEVYACPVFTSRANSEQSVLDLDLRHEGIPASRWALRGLHATLRPW